MKNHNYYIYISTNHGNTVLYTGVTKSLVKRLGEHREKKYENSFTAKYNINKIVYYEHFTDIRSAIGREKQIKAGSRKKKMELVNSMNPEWLDIISNPSVIASDSEAISKMNDDKYV